MAEAAEGVERVACTDGAEGIERAETLVANPGFVPLYQALCAYEPKNEQESADKQVMLRALETNPDCFDRSEQAHFACSAWAVDESLQQTIMIYHNIYDSWSWVGGHADGEFDLRKVALKELEEETGATGVLVGADRADGGIFSLEVLTVDGHEKRGAYVSSHLHLNVTYLVSVPDGAALRIKPDENSGIMWVPLEEVEARSTEPWIRSRIYRKLVAATKALR